MKYQIDNADRALKGVTYSYQNTSFYGKASLIGMWTPGTKNLIFKEDKLLDYKMSGSDNGDDDGVYMFTCYLEYRKEGDKEILEGSYTSQHYKTGKDGTSGKIYLEKVLTSNFKKEDFIIKKEKADSIKASKAIVKQPTVTPKTTQPLAKTTPPKTTPPKKTVPAVKPKQETVKSTLPKKITPPTVTKPEIKPDIVKTDPPKRIETKPIVLPPVLKERQNDLVRTITTSANELEVNLYDNGEIDGDTISVYLNGKQIASHRGLSTKPITLKIKIDEANPEQELTMVAENLGSIPPNTALMIVNAGDQRYDLRISSSDKNNAVVRFKYQAVGGANK